MKSQKIVGVAFGALVASWAVAAEPLVVEDRAGYNSWSMIQSVGSRLVCAYSHGWGHNIFDKYRSAYARTSDDGGRTWSDEKPVVESAELGDVPIGKGLDQDGNMLLWIRSFGSAVKKHVLYRTADGVTFTPVAEPTFDPIPEQITDVFRIPEKGRLMALWFADEYYAGTGWSWGTLVSDDNGATWTQTTVESDFKSQNELPTEPSAVYLGNGRILCVARTEDHSSAARQHQMTSTDYGVTWTRRQTNIGDISYSTPSLVYDAASDYVTCYYYQRGAGLIRRRGCPVARVFDAADDWPDSDVVGAGSTVLSDAGNVNATAIGNVHYLTYYSQTKVDKSNNQAYTSVYVLPVPSRATSRAPVAYEWTGAAGDGAWSTSGNWNPSTGCPEQNDTASVSSSVTLTPPASFRGTLSVAAAVKVTLDIPSSAACKILLPVAGGTVEKRGSGALSVSHAYGVAKGTLVAAAGTLFLEGNGTAEAPGAFNDIVVKNGATVKVVNSPAATAHGIVYRVGPMSSKISWDGGRGYEVFYKAGVLTFERFLRGWELGSDLYYNPSKSGYPVKTTCYVPTEAAPALSVRNGIPTPYCNRDANLGVVVYMVRGIVLNETTAARKNYLRPYGLDSKLAFSLFCDGVLSPGCFHDYQGSGDIDMPLTTAGAMGWNAMDFLLQSSFDSYGRLDSHPQYSCEALVDGGHERLDPDVLWCGVCCNSCTVEEGAVLSVEAGQAFAVANAQGLKVGGTLRATAADAYLFLGSDWGGDPALGARALKDFSGKVNVAATSRLMGDATASSADYTVTGKGELGMCNEFADRVGGGFSGKIGVADNGTYDWEAPICETDCEKLSALYPISTETWQFNDNVTIATPETASAAASIRVLDGDVYSASKKNEDCRASLIAKTPIPAYCPFEITADIYRDGESGLDVEWGFAAQAEGVTVTPHWKADATKRLSYVLPRAYLCLGSYVFEWSSQRALEYTTNTVNSVGENGVNTTSLFAWQKVTPEGSWTWTNGKPNRYWLKYDGFGTIRSGYVTPQGTFDGPAYAYPQLTEGRYENAGLYLSFFARANSAQVVSKGYFLISNLVVKVQQKPLVLRGLTGVGAGATLNAVVRARPFGEGISTHALSDIPLGAGSSVSASPKFSGEVTGLAFDGVTVGGVTEVRQSSGQVATVGDLVCMDVSSSLKVTGGNVRFDLPLTVTVSDALRTGLDVVDYRDATMMETPLASQVAVASASGAVRKWSVEFGASALRIAPGSIVLIFR